MSDTLPFPTSEPPEHLAEAARLLWAELAPGLTTGGQLPADVAVSLEIAVTAYARWREHEARIAREGSIVKTGAGTAQAHPSLGIASKAAATWKQFARILKLDSKRKATSTVPAFLRGHNDG